MSSSEKYYEEGINYHKERKYKEAIESFDKVIELAPNNSNAYYNRGVSKENLGQYKEAIKDYEMILILIITEELPNII